MKGIFASFHIVKRHFRPFSIIKIIDVIDMIAAENIG